MNTNGFQIIEGGRHTAAPSPQVRKEAFELRRAGRTLCQVARFIGVPVNETADLIDDERDARKERELRAAFNAGRRSLLTPFPPTMARRAA